MNAKLMRAIKSFELQDEELGSFTCYGSKFDVVDQANEVVVKGAFTESLEHHKELGTMPIFLWNHDDDEILGKWISAEEDEVGLKLTGQFNLNTAEGKRRYEELKHGDLNGFSIGYWIGLEDTETIDGVTYLKKVQLNEVSLVPFPCLQEAQVLEVKSVNTNEEEVQVQEEPKYKPLYKRSDVEAFAKRLKRIANKNNK
ncbi:HK97 family phage prohead protease [uncultured Aeromonas sp.]|uniref:HK97 family phage prohead protease n=1 Tax=uncultured Aeromonas sp. TaxID=263763 RepID=UPI00258EE1E1|nr:HK97 family phage prohead protease [uncultured Aeromonas sp.]